MMGNFKGVWEIIREKTHAPTQLSLSEKISQKPQMQLKEQSGNLKKNIVLQKDLLLFIMQDALLKFSDFLIPTQH
jgi:hypothetical protein